ncbi:hypothetical protein Tco_0639881 [Tanacetum coccineum]
MNYDSVSKDVDDEGPTAEDEDPTTEDECLTAGVESPSIDDESYVLDDEGHGRDDESHGIDNEDHSTYPEEGMIYIDILDYPPPAPPVQTPPSPEWTSGSLPISLSHSDVPSPISSPIIPLTIPSPCSHTHYILLEELSPALFERSLEYKQERVAVTFRAIMEPVLALEHVEGQMDA